MTRLPLRAPLASTATAPPSGPSGLARLLAGLLVIAAVAIAPPVVQADPRDKHDRRHHGHRHHGGHATIVVRPAWPRYAPPVYAPPRPAFHRHAAPYWYPAYGAPLHCRAWEGPVWTGTHYVHRYGTMCLMPDGGWQLID
ncbi:MAG: hypothetical protein JNK67_11655 [Alphaproteobacteria bacterium]|nr:hypothetical protein [Alphaproteobacteria bacterium]